MNNVTPIAAPPKERSDVVRALRASALKFANEAGKTGQHPNLARVLKVVAADYRASADYIQNMEQQLGAARAEIVRLTKLVGEQQQ